MITHTTKAAEMIEYLAAKGYTMEDLAELIRKLDKAVIPKENQKFEKADVDLKEQVSNILKDLGIYPVQLGFAYLHTAIIIKLTSQTFIKQLTLYSKVASIYRCAPSEKLLLKI